MIKNLRGFCKGPKNGENQARGELVGCGRKGSSWEVPESCGNHKVTKSELGMVPRFLPFHYIFCDEFLNIYSEVHLLPFR